MNGYELFELARNKGGYKTDYELCKDMEIDMQKVNNWKKKKSNPNTLTSLKLMEKAEIDVSTGIKLLEAGYAEVSLMAVTAIVSATLLGLIAPAETLYIMLNLYSN